MFCLGLQNARKERIEIMNSEYKKLKYNVDIFYSLSISRSNTQINIIIKEICHGIHSAKNIMDYNRALIELTVDFGYLCDAFYSRRPFKYSVFKLVIAQIHKAIKESFENQWNASYVDISTTDCLVLTETIYGYLKLMNKWGMQDHHFQYFELHLLRRFLFCLFEKTREIMVGILLSLSSSHYINEGKIVSSSLDGFESHLSFMVGHYLKIPSPVFGLQICVYLGCVSASFFINLFESLNDKCNKKEYFMMLLNWNSVKAIRSAQKSIVMFTKNGINLERAKKLMNDDYLWFVFDKIQKRAKLRLIESLADELVIEPILNVKSFWFFEAKEFCQNLFDSLKIIFDFLISDFLFKEISYNMVNIFIIEYIFLVIKVSKTLKLSEANKIVDRVIEDTKILENFLSEDSIFKFEKLKLKIFVLREFFGTKNVDETIACLIKMKIFFGKKIKSEAWICLMKAKASFSDQVKSYITEYLLRENSYQPLRLTEESTRKSNRSKLTTYFFVLVAWFKFSSVKRTNFSQSPEKEKIFFSKPIFRKHNFPNF